MTEATLNPEATSVLSPQEPWPGLEFYREEDRALFFGREADAESLVRMIRREVVTILFGLAGTGKTSLLHAGVFPKLREQNFLPVDVRLDHSVDAPPLGQQIRARISESARKRDVEEASRSGGTQYDETLWEYLHHREFWNKRNQPVTPVIFLDQFEEIFTLAQNRPAIHVFLSELADIVENYIPEAVQKRLEQQRATLHFASERQPYKLVLSLREDFVGRLDGLRTLMPSLMHNRYRLQCMNGEQALDAVSNPGIEVVEDSVAKSIVWFVGTGKVPKEPPDRRIEGIKELEIDPALLNVVCRELNTRRLRLKKNRITAEQLEAGQHNILEDFYDRSFEGLAGVSRIFIEDRLLTASGFRSTAPLEDATRAGLRPEVISELVKRRVVRLEDRLGIPHLELTHDVLTKVVEASRNRRVEAERLVADKEKRLLELRQARKLQLIFLAAALVAGGLGIFSALSWYSSHKMKALVSAQNVALLDQKQQLVVAQHGLEFAQKQLNEIKNEWLKQNGWSTDLIKSSASDPPVVEQAIQANQQLQALPSPISPVLIWYYQKKADDETAMRTLIQYWKSSGYRPETPVPISDQPTDALWFHGKVPVTDLKRIALSLIRAGVKLRKIMHLPGGDAKVIVGFDIEFSDLPRWTVDDVVNRDDFDSQRSELNQGYVAVNAPTTSEAAKANDFLEEHRIEPKTTMGGKTGIRTISTSLMSLSEAKELQKDMQAAGIRCELRLP